MVYTFFLAGIIWRTALSVNDRKYYVFLLLPLLSIGS